MHLGLGILIGFTIAGALLLFAANHLLRRLMG